MSSHCPVLTTHCEGTETMIIHNETGKYYNIGQIEDAFNQAKELINTILWGKIIQQAFTHVQTNFSLERYNMNFKIMLDCLGLTKK